MPSLVYAPEVEIHIATIDGDTIDVTADIVNGSCNRIVNGVSTLSFTILNQSRKYDGVFTTMDRVVCYLRRTRRMLVFSGYLNTVPTFTTYPTSISLTASCTLKRLQNFLFDPGSTSSTVLLQSEISADAADTAGADTQAPNDGGMATRTIDLLTLIAGWPKENIHIGAVPMDWFDRISALADTIVAEAEAHAAANLIGADAYLAGSSATQSSITTGGTLPAVTGKVIAFHGGKFDLTGENGDKPDDSYYCEMRWDYGSAGGSAGTGSEGVWRALMATGEFTEQQAAGIMGNCQSESGFDPTIVQGGGHSTNPSSTSGGYGLFQWTPGSKLSDYLNGATPTIANEVAALVKQLKGQGPHAEGAAGNALQAAKTVAQATIAFETQYERHADPPIQPARQTQAQAIFDKYSGTASTASKDWWKNRKILVVNPKTTKAVCVRAAEYGPPAGSGAVIGVHASMASHLGGENSTVHIAFASDATPLGIVAGNTQGLGPTLTEKGIAGGDTPSAQGTTEGTSSASGSHAITGPTTKAGQGALTWGIGQANKHTTHAPTGDPWYYHCLLFVQECYIQGAGLNQASQGTAANASRNVKYPHRDTPIDQIPAGVPLWWTGGSSGAGHVAISMGGGNALSTDHPTNSQVGFTTIKSLIDWLSSNHTFQGWSEDSCGTRVWSGDASNLPSAAVSVEKWQAPFPSYTISNHFGVVRSYYSSPGHKHTGTDFIASGNSNVHPVGPGTVYKVRTLAQEPGWGNYVTIDHGKGVYTFYAHLASSPPVNVGAAVTANTVIGKMGGTGTYAQGPHTHTELRLDEPDNYLIATNIEPYTTGSAGSRQDPPRGVGGTTQASDIQGADGAAPQDMMNSAAALINLLLWQSGTTEEGVLLSGNRALMNDIPILTTISECMTTGLRDFCSAPNGDFIAWFPDYFGHYESAGKMVISPIEINAESGLTISQDDTALKTHQFVTSVSSPQAGDATSILQKYATAGIASVEEPALMQALFNVDVSDFDDNGVAFLNRYGARVDFQPMDTITGARQEFFFAVHHFQRNWSEQFNAQIEITFMPELWPGMLVCFPKFALQGYVTEVNHSWDLGTSSQGFTTTVSCAPWSTMGEGVGPKGLPIGAAL